MANSCTVNPKVIFELLQAIETRGFECYVIGGASLALLQEQEIYDVDLTTNANARDLIPYFEVEVVNSKFGAFKINYQKTIFELTTFRLESDYANHRYPKQIKFVQTLAEDLKRRDFTINAIAITSEKQVIDMYNGIIDLEKQQLKLIGGEQKLIEDALRIVRALRFAYKYQLKFDEELNQALHAHYHLLGNLKKQAIKKELNKIHDLTSFEKFVRTHNLDWSYFANS
ncbi:MAG: hypothetical protein ACRCUP_06575 [Mycoplasmatales bacterium]